MEKLALLVGVSEYQSGWTPLPSAVKDIEAMQRVLQHPDIGGFSKVDVLANPKTQDLRLAIYDFFAGRDPQDLLLFYFSGHGVKDPSRNLYLTTPETRKDKKGVVVTPTAVEASYLQTRMTESRSNHQVIILDCCYSGAIAHGLTAKDEGEVDLQMALGGEGRAILTASTSVQSSFQQDGSLSIYTQYLVEGIETGAADLDRDGRISADELHRYTSQKVREAAPAMTPEFYPVKGGYSIYLARAFQDDPKLKYRQAVEGVVAEDKEDINFIEGEIDDLNRAYLDEYQVQLGISKEEATEIEWEVMEPYRLRHQKCKRYGEMFLEAIQQHFPLTDRTRRKLQRLQAVLALQDEDVAPIEAQLQAQMTPPEAPKALPPQAPKTEPDEVILLDTQTRSSQLPRITSTRNQGQKSGQSLQSGTETVNDRTEPLKVLAAIVFLVIGIPAMLSMMQSTPSTKDRKPAATQMSVNYTQLENYLKGKQWKGADRETAKLILQVGDLDKSGLLSSKELENFSCQDFKNIDQLWVKYSNNRFGFSVQKEIYQSLGGTREYNSVIWNAFGEAVGWLVKGRVLYYDNLTFDLTSERGHLPTVRFVFLSYDTIRLLSHVETCNV